MSSFLLISLIAFASAVQHQKLDRIVDESALALTPELVAAVNKKATTWTASLDQGEFFAGATIAQVKKLMGVKPRTKAEAKAAKVKLGMKPKPKPTAAQIAALPKTFDARLHWPQCWTITQIRDQSACGSCWAHAFAEAASDRSCTFGVNLNLTLSVQQVNSCCDECGDGCDGGQIDVPWQYWQSQGVVSANCEPYTLPPCEHHVPNATNPCPMVDYPTPNCPTWGTCPTGRPWNVYYGANPSYIDTGDVHTIMHELVTNGPIQTALSIFTDFLSLKSGVYIHTHGSFLGGHSVKIIGYGTENGVDYWLCANSWNTSWCEKGFFKIRRGTDECGIEDEVTFGQPAMNK